ncbi:hypothetical protein JCM8208_001812 [Rhodotorula glutinis]
MPAPARATPTAASLPSPSSTSPPRPTRSPRKDSSHTRIEDWVADARGSSSSRARTKDWAGDSATLTILGTVNPALRLVQTTSAATFALFGIVHLASPLSALLPQRPKYLTSAENRANGFLLVARELYQGEWTEPVWVWGSLSAHVLSGMALRWLKVVERAERRKVRREEVKRRARELATVHADELVGPDFARANEVERDLAVDEVDELEGELVATTTTDEELVVPSAVPASTGALVPLPTFHQATGYALLPFVLHHVWLHRLLPASPEPPISSLSPSFFNYTFSSLALNHSNVVVRLGSAASYAALTGLATYHGLVGARILLSPIAPRSLGPRRKRAGERDSVRRKVTQGREWQAAWVAAVVGVSVGTARIAGYLGGDKHGVRTPDFIARRMDYVLRRGFAQA